MERSHDIQNGSLHVKQQQTSPGKMSDKYIMCVGLVCVDIVNVVDHFPVEDSDQR